jgi:hypothetical protein
MEKQKMKAAMAAAAFLCAALVLAGCESPVFDEGQSVGSGAGLGVLSSTASAGWTLSLVPGTIDVNEITATWTAVAGAAVYDVYCDTTATPATLVDGDVAGNTVTITGLSAGTTYYVQVNAKDAVGEIIDQTNAAPCHTSDTFATTHLTEFALYMSNEGDYYMLDETEGYHLIYNMSDFTPYVGYDVIGEIKYIYHFGDNVPITITEIDGITTHNFTGTAGVMIFEVYEDPEADLDYNWSYTGTGNFTANYYYGGAIEDGVYTSVNMGIAASSNPNPPPPYGTPCFATLDEAIAAFSGVEKLEEYIKEPAEYYDYGM